MANTAATAPIVLLDDGELERVRVILERLDAEFTLCRRPTDLRGVPRATELFVCGSRRALELGSLPQPEEGEAGPRWLCVSGQDFGELRDELRERGVHYLVHSAVDQETLKHLVTMLLHDRGERRTHARGGGRDLHQLRPVSRRAHPQHHVGAERQPRARAALAAIVQQHRDQVLQRLLVH